MGLFLTEVLNNFYHNHVNSNRCLPVLPAKEDFEIKRWTTSWCFKQITTGFPDELIRSDVSPRAEWSRQLTHGCSEENQQELFQPATQPVLHGHGLSMAFLGKPMPITRGARCTRPKRFLVNTLQDAINLPHLP